MVEIITRYRAQGVDHDTLAEARLADAHANLRKAGWQQNMLNQDEWIPPQQPSAGALQHKIDELQARLDAKGGLSLQQMTAVLLNASKAGGWAAPEGISYRFAETLAAAALGVGAGLTPVPQNLRDLFARRELRGRWVPEDIVAVFEAGAGRQRAGLATLAAEAIGFAQQLAAAEEVSA